MPLIVKGNRLDMKVGLCLPQVGERIIKENILYIATEAEKEGFDSLWTLDQVFC